MLLDFLAHLHRGGAFAYYHALPQRRSTWYVVDDPPPLQPERARTNIYFSVHPCTDIPPCNAHGEIKDPRFVRSQKRYIAAINCLFAEFDEKDFGNKAAILAHLDDLTVPAPSVLIDSGGGVHAYWLLKDPVVLGSDEQRAAVSLLQDRWVQLVGGDRGAHDLCRVLRVPGSWNFKYEPARPVQWIRADLDRLHPLQALTAHITIQEPAPTVRWSSPRASSITEFNTQHQVGDVLERRGYMWCGRYKMLSPWSSTGQAGVTVDSDTNRAYVHHGSDPLHDGYWKRPFDVVKILDFGGDFKRTLAAVREGRV